MSIEMIEKYISDFICEHEFKSIAPQVKLAEEQLFLDSKRGKNLVGWLNIPENYDRKEVKEIKAEAEKIKRNSDVFIVIGIGGSYLGARAAIEFLNSQNYNLKAKDTPQIYFVGNNVSTSYLKEIIELCEGKEISLNVISKSGTTMEPAIAFRIFKRILEEKYGVEKAKERIYCTTDKRNGVLKKLAEQQGYKTFVIPEDIGGRFSVLTAVGLFPIAVCGADIDRILFGAYKASKDFSNNSIGKNICYRYAAIRNILYRKGKIIELLVGYEPRLSMFNEWYKQLFGESEGKDGKGIFPASVIFSTDLHSMGQFIQDGSRTLFETVIVVDQSCDDMIIGREKENIDELNFLADKTISYINKKIFEGTAIAHVNGGVPNIVLKIDSIDEYNLGYLFYFFEKACAISGYIMGVNPFDQPGVEAYKKNIFSLLEKPGYKGFI